MEINEHELKKIVDEVVSGIMRKMPTEPVQPAPVIQQHVPESNLNTNTVAIGTDHGGVALKEILKTFLSEKGYQVIDCGTHGTTAVDYPDIAKDVAQKVAAGQAWRGIVIDGAGIGSCMAANKVKGIRAALCYDYATANNAREHNNANVLTLGAGLIGQNLAKQIAETFLKTDFAGGRHAPRVDKIMQIE